MKYPERLVVTPPALGDCGGGLFGLGGLLASRSDGPVRDPAPQVQQVPRLADDLCSGEVDGGGVPLVRARAITMTPAAYFGDPTAGLRDNKVHAAVIRPPLGLPGLVSVELATERLVVSLPEDHPLAKRESLSVAEVLPEPIIAAPASPGPWRDYWRLTDSRSAPPPVVAEAGTLDLEMHLVARGVASASPPRRSAPGTNAQG